MGDNYYIFTASAFIEALYDYGEKIFELQPIVYQPALLKVCGDRKMDDSIIKLMKNHWFEMHPLKYEADSNTPFTKILDALDGDEFQQEIKFIKEMD